MRGYVEDRREKPQTPKPKTETPIPTPEREMGKREKDKRRQRRIAIANAPLLNEGPTLVAPSGVPIGRRFRKRKFIQKNQKLLIYQLKRKPILLLFCIRPRTLFLQSIHSRTFDGPSLSPSKASTRRARKRKSSLPSITTITI